MPAGLDTCDVAIIGGGVIGLSCALRIRQAGACVTLLDRGPVGREASWAGAGILDAGSRLRTDPLALLRRASVALYPALIEELREFTGIDPEYVPCGSLDLITDDNQEASARREAAAAERQRTDAGAPLLALLSAEEARRIEPQVAHDIRGALLDRSAARVRNPRLLAALRQACERAGVAVREHVPVRRIAARDGRVEGVETPAGRIGSRWVVLAAGAWSGEVFASSLFDSSDADGAPASLLPVRPVRGQIVLLEHSPPLLQRILQHGRSYLVPRNDGKLLVGSTEEPEAGFEKRNTVQEVAGLLSAGRRLVPALRDASFVAAWSGLRPGSADGMPYLGPVPGWDGLLAATGHFRSGLTLAPITAKLIAECLSGGAPPELQPLRPGRPAAAATARS